MQIQKLINSFFIWCKSLKRIPAYVGFLKLMSDSLSGLGVTHLETIRQADAMLT